MSTVSTMYFNTCIDITFYFVYWYFGFRFFLIGLDNLCCKCYVILIGKETMLKLIKLLMFCAKIVV